MLEIEVFIELYHNPDVDFLLSCHYKGNKAALINFSLVPIYIFSQ